MAHALRPIPALLLAALQTFGCKSEETERCRSSFTRSQSVVNEMDSKSIPSVSRGLESIDNAISTCELAERSQEVVELKKARAQIAAHLKALKKPRPKQEKRTPEELLELQKTGDPNCPRGMAYKPSGSDKEIRCTGPLPINMSFDKAKAYFAGRDFKIDNDPPNTLRMEYGAELFVFRYDRPHSKSPPTCVRLYPRPGMSWQEATARMTGTNPARLKPSDEIQSARGKLKLLVDEQQDKLIVHIGQCAD